MQRSSQSVASLAAALAKAQSELVNPEKSLVGTIKSTAEEGAKRLFRYAPLSSGLEIVAITSASTGSTGFSETSCRLWRVFRGTMRSQPSFTCWTRSCVLVQTGNRVCGTPDRHCAPRVPGSDADLWRGAPEANSEHVRHLL
jgi:hypothetical protein